MKTKVLLPLVASLLLGGSHAMSQEELAFEGASGFGAFAKGGKGGRVIEVTRLDDAIEHPPEGSFRWAVAQKGPRIVTFRVAGTIELRDAVEIREPFLTIDGGDAPGAGVCLRGGSLEFHDTHDLIVRHLRVRLGDETALRKNREAGLKRPKGSAGLDCIELRNCQDALFDHISASWSCDELFSVVRCQNVTVQHCLLAEPLSHPSIHPYGDNHAFCFNASASTLSVLDCVFARYVMRGPQFEANDMRKGDDHAVRMEARGNVMFDYQKSGSRYTAGIEDHPDEASPQGYQFQFIGNHYLGEAKRPTIEATLKHGVHPGVRVFASDAAQIALGDQKGRESLAEAAKQQIQARPLFESPAPFSLQSLETVLETAGCSRVRDAVDQRVITSIREKRFQPVVHSQNEVGGWPELK